MDYWVIKAGDRLPHPPPAVFDGHRYKTGLLLAPCQSQHAYFLYIAAPNSFEQAFGLPGNQPVSGVWSTWRPGPMVVDTDSFFIYTPFADVGLALSKSASKAARFSFNALTSKSTRPIGQ